MPAIFCTTEAAIVVLPCAVSSARRAGESTEAVGVVMVDLDGDDADAEVGVVILGFSRRGVDGVHTMRADLKRSREFTRSGVVQYQRDVRLPRRQPGTAWKRKSPTQFGPR